MRVHSFAVWSTVVFLLNVLAFLLMGMQARVILGRMSADRLWEALGVAGLVIIAIVVARFLVVMLFNRLSARFEPLRGDLPPATIGQGVIVSWSGMRGLVSLATAFALPSNFPQRDLVVLSAFAVVLATLVFQGLTLAPLIRLLRLDRMEDPERELTEARRRLAGVAIDRLSRVEGAHADSLRELYALKRAEPDDKAAAGKMDDYRQLGLAVIAAQREDLAWMRDGQKIGMENFYLLQEEVDWRELTLLPDSERRIDEV